jgi:hypothetical protein
LFVSRQAEKQARAEAMLGELAELALMVAKDLAVRVRETEDPDQAVALAAAFQKMSRVVRLTLALDAKLERDATRAARDAEKAAAEVEAARPPPTRQEPERPRPAPHPIEVRKDRVRSLLNRLIWNESEGEQEDYEVLLEDLDARLDEAAAHPGFEAMPIETIARRIAADMGLSGDFTLSLCEAPPSASASAPQPTDSG